MNTGYLDLHGRVRAYQDGKLIWDRPNKITTLGRKALLAAMSHRGVIDQTDTPDWFYQTDSKWRIADKAWISCYAFGNGASMVKQDNIVQMATSLKDLNMFHMVPLRKRTDDYGVTYDLSNYVELPLSSELKHGHQDHSCDYILHKSPIDSSVSDIDPDNYIYFKKLRVEDTRNETINTVNDDVEHSAARIGAAEFFDTALVVFKLKISAEDLFRVIPERAEEAAKYHKEDCKVNELGLYIAEITEGNSGFAPSKFVTKDGKPTLPIQFSHISFPTENFFGNSSKDIDLEYYVFA
jgi:hypothetical protein